MPLDKQKVALPIVDGIDTKGDEKTVLPTRFLALENVDFPNPGSIKKRNGYAALSNRTLDNSQITTGSALTSLKNELLQYSNDRLYSFSEGEQAWEDKGEIRFCSAYSSQISADNAILKNPSSFTYGGVTCYAYEKQVTNISHDVSTGPDIYNVYNVVEIVIVDDVSKATLAKHTIDGTLYTGAQSALATVNAPKVGFVGSNFVVFYYISRNGNIATSGGLLTGLSYSAIDFLNPKIINHQLTSSSSATIMSATVNKTAKFKYDLVSFNSQCFFAYADGDATDVLVQYIDSSLIVSQPTSTTYSQNVYNISLNKQGSYLRMFISALDGSGAKAYLFSANLFVQLHPVATIAPVSPTTTTNYSQSLKFSNGAYGVYSISGFEDPSDSEKTYYIWQSKPIASEAGFLMANRIDISGTQSGVYDSKGNFVTLVNPLFAGAELQSKVTAFGGYLYFYVSKNVNSGQVSTALKPEVASTTPGYASTVDNVNKPVRTLFLVKALLTNSEISAKLEVDTHVFINAEYMNGLPNVSVSSVGLDLAVSSINGLQPVNAKTLLAPAVIKQTTADFSQSLNYFDATQGESLYISGGLLKQYDGSTIVEQGFLDTPEPIKDIATTPADTVRFGDYYLTTSGGLTGGAKYFYVVVYKWTDKNGKTHHSAPSRAVETSVPGNNSQEFRVSITFTPLYFTNKKDVEIELYRTTGNGTIYHKISHVVDNGSGDDYLTGGYANSKMYQSLTVVDNVADVELNFSEPLYTTGGILENDAPEASNYINTIKPVCS